MSTGREAIAYRWIILALFFSIHAAGAMAIFAFGPLAPFLQENLGITRTQLGMFSSAIYLGMMVFSMPAGWLTDRYGIHLFLLVGPGVQGVLFSIFGLSHSFLLSLLIVFLGGIGYQFINPTTVKGLVLWFPPRLRATVIGIKQAGVSFGGASVSVLLPLGIVSIGWQGSIALIGISILIVSLIVTLLYREPSVKIFLNDKRSDIGLSSGIQQILKNRNLILLGTSGAMYGISAIAFCTYLILFLKESLSLSLIIAGSFLAIAQLGTIFGRIFWCTISDWLFGGRRKVVFSMIGFLIAIMSGMTILVLPLSSYWVSSVFFALFGFCLGFNGLYLTFMAELGRKIVGTSVGFASATWALGVVIGVPVFGYIADKTASYQLAWGYLALIALIGAGMVLTIHEEKGI